MTKLLMMLVFGIPFFQAENCDPPIVGTHQPELPIQISKESHCYMMGLSDIDIDSCEVSPASKERLINLITEFRSIFSRDKLDCEKATVCLHRIRVVDMSPLRLPCRCIQPT